MEENKKFKVNSEDTLLESRDIHTYFETNSKEEAMGYFLYKDFVEANKAFENKTNNGKRYFLYVDGMGELDMNFSQMSNEEKERYINLYKKNNAEHFRNEERLEKIKEQTSIEMGDPFGEYRNEVKGNEMKENQKNEELAIYAVDYDTIGLKTPDEGYFTTYFSSKKNAERFIVDNLFDPENGYKEYDVALFYDKNGNPEEPRKVTDDLLEMKKIAHNENAEGRNREFFHFEQKVDKKLIDFICDRYYSGYEGCEADQELFKAKYNEREEPLDYIHPLGAYENPYEYGGGGMYFDENSSLTKLDEKFKNDYFEYKHNKEKLADEPKLFVHTECGYDNYGQEHYSSEECFDEESMINYLKAFNRDTSDYWVETDLIRIKKHEFDTPYEWYYDEEKEQFCDFFNKVDEKLVEHICDKFYSGYDGCEEDQKLFKESGIKYDERGLITGFTPIGSKGVSVDISSRDIRSMDTFDKEFAEAVENGKLLEQFNKKWDKMWEDLQEKADKDGGAYAILSEGEHRTAIALIIDNDRFRDMSYASLETFAVSKNEKDYPTYKDIQEMDYREIGNLKSINQNGWYRDDITKENVKKEALNFGSKDYENGLVNLLGFNEEQVSRIRKANESVIKGNDLSEERHTEDSLDRKVLRKSAKKKKKKDKGRDI